MSYKDKKVQKEYQHRWYLRKKAGLPTKTKPVLTPEEKEKINNENKQRNNKKIREKRRLAKRKYCGDSCFVCKYDKRLAAHRKDGKPHKPFEYMGLHEFIKEIQTGEYVSLCHKCHKHIHLVMKYFSYSWSTIESLVMRK